MLRDAQAPPLDAHTLLEHAPCGLLVTRQDGTIVRANATFCTWLGYTAHELVEKRRLQELLSLGGRIFHQTHWSPMLCQQGSIAEVKLDLVHRQGHTLPMVMNAVRRLHGDQMHHEVALFIAQDRNQYERELMRARKQSEALAQREQEAQAEISRQRAAAAEDRAQLAEQMMGIVSHDLRNPLAVIRMSATLLERSGLAPDHRAVTARIHKAVGRAERLIADLLDFTTARLGQGLALLKAPIELHQVVGGSVEELAAAYPGRHLQHRRLGAGRCTADADRLVQLIGNLVSNALAYGTRHTPVVVTSRVLDEGFEVSVHNDGNPIAAEVQASLFEPMVRGSQARAMGHGVGLGLFIVQEIVRAHQGTVSVESQPGSGTTFRAWFPAP